MRGNWFITATGTEVGKTVVTSLLVRQLRAKGVSVQALKPVISGFDPKDISETDTALLLDALEIEPTEDAIGLMSKWRFREPLSPDMAALREGRRIAPEALLDVCSAAMDYDGVTLIEGVGGAFVPIDDKFLVSDWISALDISAIVVAGSYLGTISHTVSTCEALSARGIPIASVVISESAEQPVPLTEICDKLALLMPDIPVFSLPRIVDSGTTDDDIRDLPDLTEALCSR